MGAPPPPPPLPDVFMSVVDLAAVERMLDDITRAAELLAISVKAHATALAGEPQPGADLAAARAFLGDGTLRGLQLRYRFDGQVWADTLLRLPSGAFRLVRMAVG